jgi:hypothetical protein
LVNSLIRMGGTSLRCAFFCLPFISAFFTAILCVCSILAPLEAMNNALTLAFVAIALIATIVTTWVLILSNLFVRNFVDLFSLQSLLVHGSHSLVGRLAMAIAGSLPEAPVLSGEFSKQQGSIF